MRMCQHCGAGVPNYAGFCGECGQLVSISKPVVQEQALWMSHSAPPDQAPTTIINEVTDQKELAPLPIEDEETRENPIIENEETHENPIIGDEETRENPIIEDEDEDENRRREMIAFGLPLIADVIAEQPTMNVPMVQGTPQIADAPTIVGTPPIPSLPPPLGGNRTTLPLVLPGPESVFTGSLANGSPHPQRPGNPSRTLNKPPSKQPSGCMVGLIVAIVIPLLILGGGIGIGLTILAPTLSLDGNTSIATGDILHLHGGHFIPGNNVTCVLDGSIPLSYNNASYLTSGADTIADALLPNHQGRTTQKANAITTADDNATILVASDGTFSATFVVGKNWAIGQHTIRATEALSPRSATTTFTITGNGQALSTATSTTTHPATKTITPSPTPSSVVAGGLNDVTPNIITFGPLSVGYPQATSTQVLLNTTGTGLLNWAVSWDTTKAPWLHTSSQSGQIQEPATQAIIVSVMVGNLKAGTYTATLLFSSNGQNKQNFSLPISLTIQAGCVKVTPATLNFTGTLGASDPAPQTLTLNNCGALGKWTETATGGSWLLISPTGGNLNTGANQSIIVSATLANTLSRAGTYQGQITFTNGSAHSVVNVIFTVRATPLPLLSSNITSFTLQQCKFIQGMYRCPIITLHNSGPATSNLNWTATSNGIVTMVVIPQSGALQAGQTAIIEIDIARVPCDGSTLVGTVTFSGPANSIPVNVSC